MKKAFNWLDKQQIEYRFHDYKKLGIDAAAVEQWLIQLPLEQVINKRGTTWRKLPDEVKNTLTPSSAVSLIIEQHSVVKRPLLEVDGRFYLGFSPSDYESIFKQ